VIWITSHTKRGMLPIINPALGAREWNQRRSGAVSVDAVDEETQVVVCDPDGGVVTVSGNDRLFALMALANSAMSDDDPRKLCRKDLAVLSVLCEEYHDSRACDKQILTIASTLYDKLCALLPGLGPGPRPSGKKVPTDDT
jgi:hypothetical protein